MTMLFKKSLLAWLAIIFSISSQAAILILDNNINPIAGSFADYASAEASAVAGDTIMVMPSSTSYGSITMAVGVHLIGPGYISKSANGQTSNFTSISISGDASNGSISGIYQTSGELSYNASVSFLSAFTIRNSFLRRINIPGTGTFSFDNVTIEGNIVGSSIGATNSEAILFSAQTGTNQISNNIIFGNTDGWGSISASNCSITGNVFVGGGADPNFMAFRSVTGCTISNNIFFGRSPEGADSLTASVITNNLTFTTNDDTFTNVIPGAGSSPNSGTNAEQGSDPEFNGLVVSTAWDDNNDVTLQGTSPAAAASIGLDYTSFILRGSELPSVNHIFGPNISQVSTTIGLDIEVASATGADIMDVEYFYDYADPGFGNGVSLGLTGTSPVASTITLSDATSLAEGFHTVHFRVRDLSGWGLPEQYNIVVREFGQFNQNTVNAVEYFFDDDPGYGLGTDFTVTTPNDTLDISELVSTAAISEGFHILHVRSQDENGLWGLAESRLVYVDPSGASAAKVVDNAEYFFDVDPGYGAATAITVTTPGNIVDLAPRLSTASLSTGFHSLFLRVQAEGTWSQPERRLVFVDEAGAGSAIFVDDLEYFFDVDPGYGNGDTLTVSSAANIVDVMQGISTASLSNGFHSLFLRIKTDGGAWGLAERRLVFVDPSSGGSPVIVDDLEYFFDVDPGYGNGDTLTVSSAANIIDIMQGISTASLSQGFHILYVRPMSSEGVFGLAEKRLVYVDAAGSGTFVNLDAFEYFFDTDPGYGSAVEVNHANDSIIDISIALPASALSAGTHTVTVRSRDLDGNWGMGETFTFRNPSPGRELDSLSLKVFYDATDGANWSTSTNWLSGNIDTWHGVTVVGDRVDSLILPNNNLVGELPLEVSYLENLKKLDVHSNTISGIVPAEFQDLTSLQIGYIFDNQIEELPDLSAITSITEFAADSNYLDFGDLEPNNALTGFTYSNQKLPNDPGIDTIIAVGDNPIVDIETFGSSNTYQWYQDGVLRADQTAQDLNIATFTPSDTGTYHLEINNAIITDLTISTSDYRLALSDFEEDSTAMVSLYNNLDGANWTNATNWLTGTLDTWNGVTVANNRVTNLDLSSNALDGRMPDDISYADSLITLNLSDNNLIDTIPDSFNDLQVLTNLNLANNDLESIPDLNSVTSLTDMDVSGNRIQFGDLELNLGIPSLIYSPMDSISMPIDTLIDVGQDVSISLLLTGANNSYQWLKDGSNYSTTENLEVTNLAQTDEGKYRLEITNALVTGLTLYSSTIDLKVSSRERDSIALQSIRTATAGDWNVNWPTTSPGTVLDDWDGVTVVNNRVTRLEISGVGVIGDIPDDILDITGLEVIDLSDNDITYVPQVVDLLNIQELNVSNCQLGFDELAVNVGITTYTYNPQQLVGTEQTIEIQVNQDQELSVDVSGGENNSYQWKFNGADIAGATADTFVIESIDITKMGEYSVDVTNSEITDLTISSEVTSALAVTDLFGTVFNLGGATALTSGNISLYELVDSGPWDSLTTQDLGSDGTYNFMNTVLGDYVMLVRPDLTIDDELLQTYTGSTFLWEEADTVFLRDVITGENITMEGQPTDVEQGSASVDGAVEEDINNEGGRLEAGRRVKRAGVSMRRRPPDSKPENDDGFELIGYVESDDLGDFLIGNLPPGLYRFNVQFPGVPMDESTFVEFELGVDFDNEQLTLLALIEEAGISVTLIVGVGDPIPVVQDLKVYPNPGKDFINLDYFVRRDVEELNMKIVDATGRSYSTQLLNHYLGLHSTSLDISGLSAGVYHIMITDGEGMFTVSHRFSKE